MAQPARHKLMHAATAAAVAFVLYGIVFMAPTLKNAAEGVDSMQKILSERMPIEPSTWATKVPSMTRRNDNFKFEIEPMWSCRDTDRMKKLVFLHIFKTAGSSIRELLSEYAETCNAGYTTVVNCGEVTLQSIAKGNNWEKDHEYRSPQLGTSCILKKIVYRNNTVVKQGSRDPMNTTFLEEAKIDILSGHMPIGIDEKWEDDKGQHVDVQYLTFFRERSHKFVSGILYLRPHLSFEEAVQQVKEIVRTRVAKAHYLSDIKYILTPEQRDYFNKRNLTLTMEDYVRLMIQNLKDNNVLVGIVERMSESLEMLQHVVDKDGELDAMFESYGKRPPETNTTKAKIANKSKLSSEDVLAEVEKDKEFMKVMREFVKYDDEVYQFAFEMHMRQYDTFRRQQSLRNAKSDIVGAETASPGAVRIHEPQVDAGPMGAYVDINADLVPSLDDYHSAVEPMWRCQDKDRKKKLVFIHIFKTAGSTMRSLFRNYAVLCNAGLNLVIQCAPVQPSTLRAGNWIREDKVPCKLKQTVYRNSTIIQQARPMKTSYLEESNADILGGHITMGAERGWKDDKGEHVDVQYLSFFRDSARKFVSSVLFLNPRFTFHQAIAHIKEKVPQNLRHRYYLDNTGYRLTPAQRDKFRNTTLSMEDKTRLTMKNLKENNVLVGIVERMSESLEMIQKVIDKDAELDPMFESFGMRHAGSNATKSIALNKSKLSSASVLAELEKDEEFMRDLREFTKYDDMVYRFALDLHMRQYESLQRQSAAAM